MISKIYFDMDGVLADFERGIRELCKLETVPQSQMTNKQNDEMFAAMREIPNFYDKLELMPGAYELFKAVREKYGDKCEILSGIPKPHRGIVGAGEDKTAWVRRVLDDSVVVNIVYREEKQKYCTGKDCILIDDFEKNIKEWNAMGGTGILHKNATETMRALQELEIL